jgi:hypothetical protein
MNDEFLIITLCDVKLASATYQMTCINKELADTKIAVEYPRISY